MYTDAVAGKWLFEDKPFVVLNNGRNLERFRFQEDVRRSVREEYGLSDSLTIGHVGGFVPQKNHDFLLKIYEALLKRKPDVSLFMIGDGARREEIEKKAQELGIKDKIRFTGNTDRMTELLQAMDVMVLPSLFEGFPLVSIEWQAAGLPCIISDTITKECAVTDLVNFLSLDEKADIWAERLLQISKHNNRPVQSSNACTVIRQKGFDIKDNAAILKKLYMKDIK